MKKFGQDFRAFALKGNVVDMAIGVIIGGAFGKIITSLVNDVIMPLLSLLTGHINLANLGWVMKEGEVPLTLAYGQFLQSIIDFLIIALCIFFAIRIVTKTMAKIVPPTPPEPPKPPETPEDIELLREIRDLLKKR